MPELIQKSNPFGLTRNQHVLTRAIIARFVGITGMVAYKRVGENRIEQRSPRSKVFTAEHEWDEHSEHGYMKGIEDAYIELVERIDAGMTSLRPDDNVIATRFFHLWCARYQVKRAPIADAPLKGPQPERLSQDQKELIEYQRGMYQSRDGTLSGAFVAGMEIMRANDAFTAQSQGATWGIVRAREGEFVCPDTCTRLLAIPVSPTVFLYSNQPDTILRRVEVAAYNRRAQDYAQRYTIAREFKACPT